MMFVEACSSYLSDPRTRGRLKLSTLRAYRKDFAAASAALPQPLEQITAGDLTSYLAVAVAPSTAARRLAALRALFGWAAREGYIAGDPTTALEHRAARAGCPGRSAPMPIAKPWKKRLPPPCSHFASR